MKIIFFYRTDEWEKICKSIKMYLQYCHDMNLIKMDICNYAKNENRCDDVLNADNTVVVPLFEKNGREIKSNGLKIIKDLRKKKGYKFNVIFLVLSKQDIPDYFHPEKEMHYYVENLLGNPKFEDEDVGKAVFLGEIIYKNKKKEQLNEKASYEDMEYANIINLQEHDELKHLANSLNDFSPIDKKLREKYYDIFVTYYDGLGGKEKEKLKEAQKIYNDLSGIQLSPHSDKYELFKAPIPFPLLELINAKKQINNNLTKDGKVKPKLIKLLLIDNKIDKIKSSNSKQTLINVIDTFDLNSMFTIEMLGNIVYKKGAFYKMEVNNGRVKIKSYDINELAKSSNDKKAELFDYKEFKNDLKKIFRNKVDGDDNYAIKVYEKIKNCNFVLLDFFLNTENTYLAFDFIKDIAEIKKKEGDYSTTWYFITSAVYDSVVKYSQSGLLAEYYESAVVNAGDDPTNKNRQIIFIYKLLTFIQSRIKSFKSLRNAIVTCKLLNCDKEKKCSQKEATECLSGYQSLLRKYVGEFDEILQIFKGWKKEEEKFKEVVELMGSTVNQFIWLPEADWSMIQMQIENINSRLKHLEDFKVKDRVFSCKYILKEIKTRSEIY